MKTVVIGIGLIGGSMAKDLRRSGFATEITGVENLGEHAAEALRLGIADRMAPLGEAVSSADLVIVTTPVDVMLELLPEVLDRISPHATVTDMGSVKRRLTEAVRNHPRRRNYVPAHPMAGTENSGPSAAMEDLFRGKIAIVCDQEMSGPQHLALAEKMFHALGMNIAYMTSDEQDHSTAFVSHLPHAAAYALANAVLAKEERQIIFDLASGGFNSTVRLAKSSCDMWHPIFEQNCDYVVESLNVYIKHLEQFRDAIRDRESCRLADLILNANRIRSVLEGENHQFIKNEETFVKLYTK
ncbi:MAG: prephenate dehydrogenase [Prolixibacteraceae bacterium]|jgi:prephenate dehydrogenase|nr:MAG: T-protein [Bacteroidetes bacterium ADurb.Bin123]HNZ67848.1 prephenate dehydrogenase [Prolixibacteraceae bacterium]HOC85328.1 prephenate dehydrogenase [Prolixibacteraceae bacterium]HOG94824.1 prephenate dehydrogenase [Prolixibacteraceae bacterium]HPY26584.1 prephenate dehydrogenase [Prolixibacteraceae bacterium]